MRLSERIAKGIGIDESYVTIIASRNNLYAKYYIPKKNGRYRLILQPSKELKVLQHWLLRNIFAYFPVSEYSSAYSKGNSVRKNAAVHKEGRYLLHTDITNFFPTISRTMLKQYFQSNESLTRKLGMADEDIELILDICLYRGENLVVGSVASPQIANMLMYAFDLELKQMLDGFGSFRYTRYADDIVISSMSFIDEQVLKQTEQLMIKYGFKMNHEKTYYMGKNGKRQVTGIVLDNNRNALTIGNKKYKKFQRMLYDYLVKGHGDLGYIKGYFAYIQGVSRQQYDQLAEIYKRYDMENVLFHNANGR